MTAKTPAAILREARVEEPRGAIADEDGDRRDRPERGARREEHRQPRAVLGLEPGGADLGQVAPFGDEDDDEHGPQRRPEPGLLLRPRRLVALGLAQPHEHRAAEEEHTRADVDVALGQLGEERPGRDRDDALHRERERGAEEDGERPVARGEDERRQGRLVGQLSEEDDAEDGGEELERHRAWEA